MESSIFSSAICNERKYIPGRRRKWKAMKATKWNKVKKFETWRSWTFFCSLSRVSAHECFKSFCRLPRRDREVVNRLTCFFDMKSKKKNLNDLFQKCGVSVVRQQSRFYQDDVVNSNKKKSLRQQSGKSINIIFFTTILWTVAICKTRAFLQSLLAKKLHKCNEKVVNPTCKRWSIRTWSFPLYFQFRQVCNT